MSGGAALFSPDSAYRYLLRRRIGGRRGRLLFVMLNPSKADETRDDATIRRCIGFAERWGYGEMEVANLFGLMATDARELLRHDDPVGAGNDAAIRAALARADVVALARADVVALAWGNHAAHPKHRARAAVVMRMIRGVCMPYRIGGLTKQGQPRHPLRLAYDATLVPYE